jgi:AcrR family transcriptional regulator
MRVRTDKKRQEILNVASELFQKLGYERTSMALISEKLGGSKATLYGYFRSKEELLHAVLDYDVSHQADRLMEEFLGAKDLRDGLIKLGIAYLLRRLAPTPISNVRIVATQPESSDVGRNFYNNVLGPAWQRLASRFEKLMDAGLLRRADPWAAAMQWKGLCEWDMFDRRLLGVISEADPKEVERAATMAADAFLKLYGVDQGQAAVPAKSKAGSKAKATS